MPSSSSRWSSSRKGCSGRGATVSDPKLRATLAVAAVLLVVLAAVPGGLGLLGRSYLYQIANLALIFALLAASLHLVTGVAGMLHLGPAAFYGVGAYPAALLSPTSDKRPCG